MIEVLKNLNEVEEEKFMKNLCKEIFLKLKKVNYCTMIVLLGKSGGRRRIIRRK
jgi:hypothetical protein